MQYRSFALQVQLPEVAWQYMGGPGALRHAVELGATLIDTAESYDTEEIVGQALQGIRHKAFLATKISPHHFRRRIGVSNFLAGELRRAQAALSRHRIFSNQVRYSLIDRTIEGRLLACCQENHIAVIAFTPLGHGLDQISWMDPTGVLERIAEQCGKTRAQVALNWCLAKEGVVTIPKASTIEHVARTAVPQAGG